MAIVVDSIEETMKTLLDLCVDRLEMRLKLSRHHDKVSHVHVCFLVLFEPNSKT